MRSYRGGGGGGGGWGGQTLFRVLWVMKNLESHGIFEFHFFSRTGKTWKVVESYVIKSTK